MAACVFCGTEVRKSSRTKEHILPMWLLEATGDPHRKIRIEFDPDSGADIIRPASTFHFPACDDCNKNYGKRLETQAKKAMARLCSGGSLQVSQCYRLLDWLDKVRIGLWLGYHMLHKEVFVPKFRIDSRLGKKDRIAIVSVDPEDRFKGFSIGGCDNNIFRTSQAAVYLRVNNVRILSVSFDSVISAFAGVPSMKEMFVSGEDPSQHIRSLDIGDYKLSQNWRDFAPPGSTVLAQPVCWPGKDQPNVLDIFFNKKMVARLKDKPRLSKPEHLDRFYQMQLISNANGSFRYHANKSERIRFGKAQHNDDASFMRSLYAILVKHVLPLGPTRVISADGKKHGTILLALLQAEKLLQIVFRLQGLGISDPKLKADLVDEVHLLTRLREESQSHLHGTCEPGSGRLLTS